MGYSEIEREKVLGVGGRGSVGGVGKHGRSQYQFCDPVSSLFNVIVLGWVFGSRISLRFVLLNHVIVTHRGYHSGS